jgi:hypothetical protein
MDGQPERNIAMTERRAATTEKNIQKCCGKCSALLPVFLLLVEGDNLTRTISDYALKSRERSLASKLYTLTTKNTTAKGAEPMQTISTNEDKANSGVAAAGFKKRIGSTTFVVSVHYSRTSKETFEDKILRLIQSEAKKTA